MGDLGHFGGAGGGDLALCRAQQRGCAAYCGDVRVYDRLISQPHACAS